jgi:hypothetical protein
VETEADLGTGYLQRVESGRVAHPERATLERILGALEARYSERRDVLEAFGYAVTTAPPTSAEIAWARDTCRGELDAAPFPAYVLDCTHRLICWNALAPRLFGVVPDDPTLGGLARGSFVAAWFDPASPIAPRIVDREALHPALIRALRFEVEQFHGEPWYPPLLATLLELPAFRRTWEQVEREPATASAGRALVPIRLNTPDAGPLQFRLASERFVRDARFRMIFYFPGDLPTMRWCAARAGG